MLHDPRVLLDFMRRAFRDFDAEIQNGDTFGNGHHDAHVMFDEQNGDIHFLAHFANKIHHRQTFLWIHACGRFVQEQEFGFGPEGTRNFQTPLIAIRQILGEIVFLAAQTDKAQQLAPVCRRRVLPRACAFVLKDCAQNARFHTSNAVPPSHFPAPSCCQTGGCFERCGQCPAA